MIALLSVGLVLAVEPYANPANPRAPAYVIAEDAALQTTFAVEKFPKVLVAGRWADQSIAPTDRVYIPAGVTVLIDTTDAVCESIRVDGTLKFARNTDTKLFVTTIVGPLCSSTLDAGTQADPITAKCEVVFRAKAVDINEDPREFGTGYVGHRTLVWGVPKSATVEFVSAPVGAVSLALNSPPVGWAIGDAIVLAGPQGFEQDEKRTITGINGAQVSFAEPLKCNHSPAFAINLTRNITFRSENAGYGNTEKAKWPSSESYSPPVDPIVKQRGHFMVMGCGVGNSEIGYAAFNDLGRTDKRTHLDAVKFKDGKRLETLNGRPSGVNQVGRYSGPHFHHGGRLGTPALVRGCAVSGSPGWGFTNHSSNVHFLDSVAYDFIGAGFSCEIGDEVGLAENCAAIGGRGGFANRDGVVNSPLFDREQGTNGAGFWSQTAGRVRYRNLRAANCVSGFNFWAGPGTQVYSNLANRVDGNIMGAIDPADIDPAGPDAYLLKLADPATGTINPIRSRLDFDGGAFVSASEGDFMLGPATASPGAPHLIRNLKAGGVNAQYTLYTSVEDARLELPRQEAPYIVGLQFSGTDNTSVKLRNSVLTNWGKGISVPMGVNEVSGCTLANALDVYVPSATLVNISSHPQRPRELWMTGNTHKNTALGWAGVGNNIPLTMDRIVFEGKQLYPPQSERDYIPFPTVNPVYTPDFYAGKTNAQLLAEYGVCVNGDVTPATAALDPRVGFKTGPISPRIAFLCRPDGYQNTMISRASGTIAKLPIEVYPQRQAEPVIVNVEHPVKPGWQPVFFNYEGLLYSVNVFGTGSTPPPEPPVPPPLVVTTVEVSPANLTLEVGKTAQLTAVVKDQFGAVMPGKAVTWALSDSSIASVSPSGGVTAIRAGLTVVTASTAGPDGKQGAANVTVTSPPQPAKTLKKVTVEFSDGSKVELP